MIEPAEQLRMLEAHVDAAIDELVELLLTHRTSIRVRAIERVASLGLSQYGDRTWHLPGPRLLVEAIDELADGAFYLVPQLARDAGDLRTP